MVKDSSRSICIPPNNLFWDAVKLEHLEKNWHYKRESAQLQTGHPVFPVGSQSLSRYIYTYINC